MNTSETSPTSFENKVRILSDFSVRYKNDDRFSKLFRDNDLGFPYSFGVQFGHFEPNKRVTLHIEDTWNMFLIALLPEPEFGFVQDPGVSTLDELVELAGLD